MVLLMESCLLCVHWYISLRVVFILDAIRQWCQISEMLMELDIRRDLWHDNGAVNELHTVETMVQVKPQWSFSKVYSKKHDKDEDGGVDAILVCHWLMASRHLCGWTHGYPRPYPHPYLHPRWVYPLQPTTTGSHPSPDWHCVVS
jgi:hypothetical protein